MLKCQICLLERITLLSLRHTEEKGVREASKEVSAAYPYHGILGNYLDTKP